jgi:Right handed beta helix region
MQVRTELELRAALPNGGQVHVEVEGEVPITGEQVVALAAPGTVLSGLGKDVTRLTTKVGNPNDVSWYVQAKGVTIRDLTLDGGFNTGHCVYGDCFNDPSGLILDRVRLQNVKQGVTWVGDLHYGPMRNFVFRDSEIIDHKGKGMMLDCEMLNPVIEGFYTRGFGKRESHTAIWIGQGILGGRISGGKIENSGYNGLEVFYPQCYPTKSSLSRDNPHGAGMVISDIEMDGVANIACSLAGCKRSVISNIHIREAGSGMEYIDEINDQDGKILYSDYVASNVTVAGIKGVGITIHRLKRGRFTNHTVTDCGSFGVQIYDGADEIVFSDSTVQRCADKMVFCNGAPSTVVTGNTFLKAPGDPATFGYYAWGGKHIFQNNILKGGLQSGAGEAQVFTAPGVLGVVSSGDVFTDHHNYRFE